MAFALENGAGAGKWLRHVVSAHADARRPILRHLEAIGDDHSACSWSLAPTAHGRTDCHTTRSTLACRAATSFERNCVTSNRSLSARSLSSHGAVCEGWISASGAKATLAIHDLDVRFKRPAKSFPTLSPATKFVRHPLIHLPAASRYEHDATFELSIPSFKLLCKISFMRKVI